MEIKIVITFRNEKALIGVQSPNRDPFFETATGDLQTVIGRVTKVVTAAQAKWATAPKNPNIDIPETAPPKEAAAAATKARPVPAAKSARDQIQQPMF